MFMNEKFSARATGVGSLPLTSPSEACNLILDNLCDIPFWPQLSNLSFKENMYAQFMYPIPGAVVDEKEKRVFVNTKEEPEGFEYYLSKIIEEEVDFFQHSKDYFAGLYEIMDMQDRLKEIMMFKGQITGPISLGFQVTDEARKPIYYNEIYRDLIIKTLKIMGRWQERALKKLSDRIMMFIDEPYLSMIGSAFISLSKEKTIEHINEVLSGIEGTKAIHCCANTDWSIVLSCDIDVLSFDAFGYSDSILLYPEEVSGFIEKGGTLAWGIVPTSQENMEGQSVASLTEKLEGSMRALAEKGISFDKILECSLITPSCGLGPASQEYAKRALPALKEVSSKIREKYNL
jgi:methionine synthase II (cobalamin-independent)